MTVQHLPRSSVEGLPSIADSGLVVPEFVGWLSGRTTIIEFWSPIVALCVALVVGIGFGVYPARRAAMLDPIEALRAE
jgi:putative ABC transport system permease protein